MSYWYERFNDVLLPEGPDRADAGTGEARDSLLELPGGGIYDADGSERSPRGLTLVRQRGVLIVGCNAGLRERYAELRALARTRGILWRRHTDGRREWAYARLLSIDTDRRTEHLHHLELDFTWALLMPYWCGDSHDITTVLDSYPKTITLPNNGNVDNTGAVLTLTAVGEDLDGVTVSIAGVAEWAWTGDLNPGQSLVIDCGARSVLKEGADAYSGFALGAGHASDHWLPLAPDDNSVVIDLNTAASFSTSMSSGASGASTLRAQYCDSWE